MPINLVEQIQLLAGNVVFINMNGSGKNALDFHIAFYLGNLTAVNPELYYHIVSADSGFDPLINHLKDKGIKISRVASLGKLSLPKNMSPICFHSAMTNKYYAEIPIKRTATAKTKIATTLIETPGISPKSLEIVENIKNRVAGRPKSVSTLKTTIKSLYAGKCSSQEEDNIINYMKQKKMLIVSDSGSIIYNC